MKHLFRWVVAPISDFFFSFSLKTDTFFPQTLFHLPITEHIKPKAKTGDELPLVVALLKPHSVFIFVALSLHHPPFYPPSKA